MVHIRLNMQLNIHNKLMNLKRRRKNNSKPLRSPERKSPHRHRPTRGHGSARLVLQGGLATAVVAEAGVAGASLAVAFLVGLVAVIPQVILLVITRALAGMTEMLMESRCRARRPTL